MLSVIVKGSTRLISSFSLPTVAALVGAALSVWGLHMVYPPLAFVVPGVTLLGFGVWLALPVQRRR